MRRFEHLADMGEEIAQKVDSVYCDTVDILYHLEKRAKTEEVKTMLFMLKEKMMKLQRWLVEQGEEWR